MDRQIKSSEHCRTMPEWKKQVDQTLWTYSRVARAVSYQQVLIAELEATVLGKRMDLEWKGQGGQKAPQEKLVLELEQAKERYRMLVKKRENILRILDWIFPPGTEKRLFVEAYWLTSASTEVQVRVGCVLRVLPFLGEWTEHGTAHGNRNFYYWRNSIYQELAEGLGYLPEYEHMVFSKEL